MRQWVPEPEAVRRYYEDVSARAYERAADVKSGPIGSRVTVAEGDGVAEYRGLRRVGSD